MDSDADRERRRFATEAARGIEEIPVIIKIKLGPPMCPHGKIEGEEWCLSCEATNDPE